MHSCIRKPGSLGQSFSALNHPTSYCDLMASLTEKDPPSSCNLRHLDTRSVSILHHPRRVIVILWCHCLTRICHRHRVTYASWIHIQFPICTNPRRVIVILWCHCLTRICHRYRVTYASWTPIQFPFCTNPRRVIANLRSHCRTRICRRHRVTYLRSLDTYSVCTVHHLC